MRLFVNFNLNQLFDYIARASSEQGLKLSRVYWISLLDSVPVSNVEVPHSARRNVWAWGIVFFQQAFCGKVSSGDDHFLEFYTYNRECEEYPRFESSPILGWTPQSNLTERYLQWVGHFARDCVSGTGCRFCLCQNLPSQAPHVVSGGGIPVQTGSNQPKTAVVPNLAGRNRRKFRGHPSDHRIGTHYNLLRSPNHNSSSSVLGHRIPWKQCDEKNYPPSWKSLWLHGDGTTTLMVPKCAPYRASFRRFIELDFQTPKPN